MELIIKCIGPDRRNVRMSFALAKKIMGVHVEVGKRRTIYRGPLIKDQNKMRELMQPESWAFQDCLEEVCGFLVTAKRLNWSNYYWTVEWSAFEQYLENIG